MMGVAVPGRVTIIVPTYNSALHLAAAIDSALAQTHPDFEVIVVNDGSIDTTPELLSEYDGQIVRIDQQNAGLSSARNRGILESTGEFIAFLDADDLLLPHMLESLVPVLQADTECGLVYGGYHQINSDGSKFGESALDRPSGNVFNDLMSDGLMIVGSAIIRRSALVQSGLFDPMLPQLEDRDLWIRIAYYYSFQFVPVHVVSYRSGETTMSRNRRERKFASQLLINKLEVFLTAKKEPRRLLRVFRRSLYSHYPNQCIQDAFTEYWAGRHKMAFRKTIEGVAANPRFLFNRGVLSILVKSFIGRRNYKQ